MHTHPPERATATAFFPDGATANAHPAERTLAIACLGERTCCHTCKTNASASAGRASGRMHSREKATASAYSASAYCPERATANSSSEQKVACWVGATAAFVAAFVAAKCGTCWIGLKLAPAERHRPIMPAEVKEAIHEKSG